MTASAQIRQSRTGRYFLLRLEGQLTMVLVEHDTAAVFALADRISVLIRGRLLMTGTPAAVRADPQVVAAYLGERVE